MERNYDITFEEYKQRKIKLDNLVGFQYSEKNTSITCNDGEIVKIVSDDKDDHLRLKLSFQLAHRYVDEWRNHLQLVENETRKNECYEPVPEDAVNIMDRLKTWCKKFSQTDDNILLALMRASDFINRYSEIAIITAFFALEIQINQKYSSLNLPRNIEDIHSRVSVLHSRDFIKSHKKVWALLALERVRNALAHNEWDKNSLEKAEIQPTKTCKSFRHRRNTSNRKLMKVLFGSQYSSDKDCYFVDSRLSHESSRLIIKQIIDSIITIQKIR